MFRIGTVFLAALLLAGCGRAPELSAPESRKLVLAALAPCDAAVGRLGDLTGAKAAAVYDAGAKCHAASDSLIVASLPERIAGPCTDAARDAAYMADVAKDALKSGNPWDEGRFYQAQQSAVTQRETCRRAMA